MNSTYFITLNALVLCTIFFEIIQNKSKTSLRLVFILVFFLFTLGPFYSILFEIPVYVGIDLSYVDKALFFYIVCFGSILLGQILSAKTVGTMETHYLKISNVSSAVLILSIFCISFMALVVSFFKVGFFVDIGKVEKISQFKAVHYGYLTAFPIMVVVFFGMFRKADISRSYLYLFMAGMLFYILYGINMSERDFILLFLLLLVWFNSDRLVSLKFFIILSSSMLILFSFLSIGRSGVFDGASIFSMLLNQGSNLNIVTNVLNYIDSGGGFIFGESFFTAFFKTLTFNLISLNESQSAWFSKTFFPTSNLGEHGFAIEAEVYINFGFVGIIIFFTTLSFLLKKISDGVKRGDLLSKIFFYYTMFFFLYGIRGESLILIKSLFYVAIFFIMLLIIFYKGKIYVTKK